MTGVQTCALPIYLLHALAENVQRYEQTFGEIKPRAPKAGMNPAGGIPNPFMDGGNA